MWMSRRNSDDTTVTTTTTTAHNSNNNNNNNDSNDYTLKNMNLTLIKALLNAISYIKQPLFCMII